MDCVFVFFLCFTGASFAKLETATAEDILLQNPIGRKVALAEFLFSLHPHGTAPGASSLTLRRAMGTSARSPIRMGFTKESDYFQAKAKKAWFEKLDRPTWQQAVDVISEAARSAVVTTELDAACNAGVDQACETLSREEEAKQLWLAKLDVPAWGAAAKAVSLVSSVASEGRLSEDAAKKQWLAKLDKPTWGKAAKVVNEVAAIGMVSEIDQLRDQCSAGNSQACDVLSREQEAKKQWLAKLDAPTWQRVSNAVSEAADTSDYLSALTSGGSEEEAKRVWLAKRETPAWGKAVNRQTASSVAPQVATSDAPPTDYLSSLAPSSEEEAKRRWLAQQDQDKPRWGTAAAAASQVDAPPTDYLSSLAPSSEEEAKRRWLAQQDQDKPRWGKAAAAAPQVAATPQFATSDAPSTDYLSSLAPSSEEEAKRRWLAQQDQDKPRWGKSATADSQVADYLSSLAPSSEEEAKRRWLAQQDQDRPSWGKTAAAATPQVATSDAPPTDYLSSLAPSSEEEAKRRWLAQQDQDKPRWGRTSASAPQVVATLQGATPEVPPTDYLSSMAPSSEEEAKRRWLAQQDQDKPRWGRAAAAAPQAADYLSSVAPSSEEEAKRRWLAQQDQASRPGWGRS